MGNAGLSLFTRIWRWIWQGSDDSLNRKVAWRIRREQDSIKILHAAAARGEDVAERLSLAETHLTELRCSQPRGNTGAFIYTSVFAAGAAVAAASLADFQPGAAATAIGSLIAFLLGTWQIQRTLTRTWAGRLLDLLTVPLILGALTMVTIGVGKMRHLL